MYHHHHANIKKIYVLNFFSSLPLSFTMVIWMLYLQKFGFSLFQVTLLQGILNLGMLLFEIPTGVLADYIGKKISLNIAYVCLFIHNVLLLLLPNMFFLQVIGFFSAGLGYVLLSGSMEALLYESMANEDDNNSTKTFGLFASVGNWASIIGLLSGGILYQISGKVVYGSAVIANMIAFTMSMLVKEIPITKTSDHTEHHHLGQFLVILKEQKKNIAMLVSFALIITIVSLYYIFAQETFREVTIAPYMIGIILR